jgi:hypothetical protein
MQEQLGDVAASLQTIQYTLGAFQQSASAMLAQLLTGEYGCPRYVCVLPVAPPAGWAGKLLHWSKPMNWVNKEVTVYFVCPVTLACTGDGYSCPLRLGPVNLR